MDTDTKNALTRIFEDWNFSEEEKKLIGYSKYCDYQRNKPFAGNYNLSIS